MDLSTNLAQPVSTRERSRLKSPNSEPRIELSSSLGPGNFFRLARASGISRSHVSRILRGVASPSFSTAMRLAQAAGVTGDVLHAYIKGLRAAEAPSATE